MPCGGSSATTAAIPRRADVARVMRLLGFRNKRAECDDAAVIWAPHDGGAVQPEQFAHLPPSEKATSGPPREQGVSPSAAPSRVQRETLFTAWCFGEAECLNKT